MSSSKCNFLGTFAASLRMYASVLGFLKGSFLFVLRGDDSLNLVKTCFSKVNIFQSVSPCDDKISTGGICFFPPICWAVPPPSNSGNEGL